VSSWVNGPRTASPLCRLLDTPCVAPATDGSSQRAHDGDVADDHEARRKGALTRGVEGGPQQGRSTMFDSAQVSRRLDIPPLEVREAVAEWHQSLLAVPRGPRPVPLGRGLWLALRPEQVCVDPLRLYAIPGILWVWCRPIQVSLEFSKWSTTDSEVALRPASLGWPVQTELYARRAVTVIDDVSQSLNAFAVSRSVDLAVTPVISSVSPRWWALRDSNPGAAGSAISAA